MAKPSNPILKQTREEHTREGCSFTLRDLFAAFCAGGLMSRESDYDALYDADETAREVGRLADAMLAEREEEQ